MTANPFARALVAGTFPVALEITPPKSDLPGVLLRRARMLGGRAPAVNVIQRSGRLSSLEASLALQREGLDAVWHLANRGSNRATLAAAIERAAAGGISQVLCLRGDHTAADSPQTPTIREMTAMVRNAMPNALVGATLNQYLDAEPVLRNLSAKLEAGANYIQTQPVFDPARLEAALEALHERAGPLRTVAMVMPITSLAAAERIEERIGAALPATYREALARGEESGWEAFESILDTLRHSPLVDGVAIMTLAMDPPPAFTERLCLALDRVLPRD